jgi:hypothetical protein
MGRGKLEDSRNLVCRTWAHNDCGEERVVLEIKARLARITIEVLCIAKPEHLPIPTLNVSSSILTAYATRARSLSRPNKNIYQFQY